MGCDASASDINPIARLLTWASFNIVGADESKQLEINKQQKEVSEAVFSEIDRLQIESDAYVYTEQQKVQISSSISAGKKGKLRSPEMLQQMARQQAMNFKTPVGIFGDRSKAQKAYFELGYSKQDFKKLCKFQSNNFYFTEEALTNSL